ncbi:hypothetical protein WN51_11341 [Melipona quadrifasciata]|uniref:Uncharacterized protein n=1 Tax=Melipona quadrifasciata TaxID=166423 RepID=A0A0N0BJW1_9HYME|nr:hypothetical protein WN51_11341 [Melipona quadrifasciata]
MIDDETKREFEATIGLNLALLKFSGVVSCEKGLVNRNVLAGLALFCLTIFSISYVYQFATNLNDMASMLESFSMVIPLVGGQTRFMTVLWFRDSCRAMLNVCEYFWSTLNSYEKEIVRGYTNKAKLLTGFYVAICVLTILLVLLFSLMSNVIVKSKLNFENVTIRENASSLSPSEANGEPSNATENKRHLPYAFFIDVQKTPWYEVLYVLQITFMTNVGFTCVAVDTIGPLFILITCGYFDTIRSRIENLHLLEPLLPITAEARTTDRVESSRDVDTRKLRTCVIHHQLLLK